MKQIAKSWVYLALSLSLVPLPGVYGQDQRPSISPQQLVDEALQANPEIKAAERKWQASLQQNAQLSALPDPLLGYAHFFSSVETRVGPQRNVFTLAQRIPFPGKQGMKGKMADQAALVEQRGFEIVRREVIFKVKSAYYDLYWVDSSLEILDEYLQLLQGFTRIAEQEYATGQGIQAHVLKSQVEGSTILERKLGLERTRQSIVERINALLNRPAGSEPGSATAVDTVRPALNEQMLIEQALEQREELLAVDARIARSELMKGLAKKEFLPDFNVQATYIDVARGMSTAPDAGKDAWSLMIGVNVPIWLGKRNAAVREAEETISANKLSYENARNQVVAEIRDLVYRIEITGRALDLYEQGLLTQAESSLQSALASYQSGRLDFLNLLDSERMLLGFRLAYVKEQATYQKDLAALDRAIGGSLP